MKGKKATNVTWHEHKIASEDREKLLNQKGVVLWFTGLSGSGKSTVANEVAYKLHLPPGLSGVHSVFHVSLLKKCLADVTQVILVQPDEL